MAKYFSSDTQFWFGGYDLGQDTTEVEMSAMARDVVYSALTLSAEKAVAGPFAGEFSHDGLLDDRSGGIVAAMNALVATTPAVTMAVANTQGKRSMSGLVLETKQSVPANLGGLIIARIAGMVDNKVEVGLLLQPKAQFTSNTNSASVDNGASSANGGVGFLHVFAADGTCDVDIEESSDDGAGDAFTAKLSFTQFSGITSERVAVSGTVERYLRVAVTLGTATDVTLAVTFTRG